MYSAMRAGETERASAYSTTSVSFVAQSRTPMDGRSCGLRTSRFEVEFEFAEVLGFEFLDLQLEGHEALQFPVEKKEVEAEILAADLKKVLLAHEAEIAAQLDEEATDIGDERVLEIAFGMAIRQVEKIKEVGVLEDARGGRVNLCHRS